MENHERNMSNMYSPVYHDGYAYVGSQQLSWNRELPVQLPIQTHANPLQQLATEDTQVNEQSQTQPQLKEPEIVTTDKRATKEIVKTEDFTWLDDTVYYFITQWQNEPCLYDVNDSEYHLKDRRMLAVERIRENMSAREFFPLPTIQNDQCILS